MGGKVLGSLKSLESLRSLKSLVSLNKKDIMNLSGLLVGLATFLIIGLFHPIVIKSEYHFGVRCWWVFLLVGIAFAIASCLVHDIVISTILGVTAFSCFWSILELFEQRERVRKGWFPRKKK